MKELKLSDLNQTLVKANPIRAQAMLDFANLTNAMYGSLSTPHTHLIGDCVLGKLNMLRRGKQIRENENAHEWRKPPLLQDAMDENARLASRKPRL